MNPDEQAAADFTRCVWPILAQVFVGGEVVSVETNSGHIAGDLDSDAGIDVYIKMPRGPIQTFACRIQWRFRPDGSRAPWGKGKTPMTYTIRSRTERGSTWTELQKRTAARQNGGLSPHWTLHAYLERPGGPVENLAFMWTEHLYRLVIVRDEAGAPFERKGKPPNAEFVIVPWLQTEGWRWFRGKPQEVQPSIFPIGDVG